VAKYFQVDVVTIRRLVSRGELAAYRVGGEFRFTQQDVREYLERQHIPARRDRLLRHQPAGSLSEQLNEIVYFRMWPRSMPSRPKEGQARKGAGNTFDTFTKRAKRALVYAHEEARQFHHSQVGPEHILLGLVRDAEGVTRKVLNDLGLELADTRVAVEAIVGRGEASEAHPDVELNEPAKHVIEYALDQSRLLDHQYVEPEHLLLGLLHDPGSVACQALAARGVQPDQVRQAVMLVLGKST